MVNPSASYLRVPNAQNRRPINSPAISGLSENPAVMAHLSLLVTVQQVTDALARGRDTLAVPPGHTETVARLKRVMLGSVTLRAGIDDAHAASSRSASRSTGGTGTRSSSPGRGTFSIMTRPPG